MTWLPVVVIAAAASYVVWQLTCLQQIIRTEDRLQSVQNSSESPAHDYLDLSSTLSALLPETHARRQRQTQQLAASGYHAPTAWQSFNALRFVLISGTLLLGLTFVNLATTELRPYALVTTAVLPIVAWTIPGVVISQVAMQRQAAVVAGLPDMLSLLIPAVNSGRTISQSLCGMISQISRLHPELAENLQIMTRRSDVVGWSSAVAELSRTYPCHPVQSLCTLLGQSERLGSKLTESIRRCSNDLSEDFRHSSEKAIQQVSILLLFPTVLCLVPAVFLVLAGPSMLAIEEFAAESISETAPDAPAAGTSFIVPVSP